MYSGLKRCLLSLCVLSLALAAGCGSGDRPELGDVSGRVTLDGKPLAGVEVLFGPEAGRTSAAMTDEDGYYTLHYLPDVEGAQLGKHRVVIQSYLEDESDPETLANFVEIIPSKYNTRSELTAEVKEGSNTIDFPLESN